jgi:CBS domain containing-hemolysin-like protein
MNGSVAILDIHRENRKRRKMEHISQNLLIIVLLLVANAFFVAAEFALVKASGVRLETLVTEGKSGAVMTVKIHGNLEAYLAACQLGITMASLGLGWVGEPTVAALLEPVLEPFGITGNLLHTISFLVGFIVFSSLHIVIGEQVPKTYAIRKPEPVSLAVAYPLYGFYILLFPLNWLLNKASGGILRMMGIAEASHGEILTGSEIRSLVDTSVGHGEVTAEHADLIHNIFSFDKRHVERVMISRMECSVLRLDAPPEETIKIVRATRHSRFPVIDGSFDNLVGIVIVKDLFDAMLAGKKDPWTNIKPYCRQPLVVPETLPVGGLFDTMRTERAHMACVIDEYGAFTGLVTLEDLLEEIVGEIADETDTDETEFVISDEGDHWLADGLASFSDIERVIGFDVDDTFEANTLSGLFMVRLNRVPQQGDEVVEGKFRFTVMELKDRRAGLVKIEKI